MISAEMPVDRQRRRPRRRAARPLVEPPAREVQGRRPAHRVPPGGHARSSTAAPTSRHPAPRASRSRGGSTRTSAYSVKRLIAAAGYPPDEIGMHGITYDEMRPGLLAAQGPPRRHGRRTTSRRRCASRTTRGSAARSSCAARTRSSRSSASRPTTTGMVDEWARRVRRPPHPAVPRPAVGRRARGRRGAPQRGARRARGRVQRAARRGSACRRIHSGYWDPFFAGLRRDRHGARDAHRLGHEDDDHQSADAPEAVQGTGIFANSAMSLIDFLFSGVLVRYPDLKLLYAEAQIGWIPYVVERTDDIWKTHRGLGPHAGQGQRTAVDLLLPPGLLLLLQGPRRHQAPRPRSASTTSASRPTTRTRTAPGPTRRRSPRRSSATSPRSRCARSLAATPSSCSGLDLKA